MIRISEPRIIVALVALAVLFARPDILPVKGQSHSSEPDTRQILESSIAATQRHWQARLHYTYIERNESRRRDPAGRLTSVSVDVSRTILVNGVPFDQLVEHNGQPPSAEEERKAKEKLDKFERESPARRNERLRQQEEENISLVREVPKAFDFQFVGEDAINGRPAYILQATPRHDYHAPGKYGTMLSKVAGRLWVDKQDFGWIKVDGHVIQPFSMGLFLVRMQRGSRIGMEQTRVDGGNWMPARVEVRASAKILFVKSFVIDRVLTYSEYRLGE